VYNIILYTYGRLLVLISYLFTQCTVMDNLKLINAGEAKATYACKNTEEKLDRTIALFVSVKEVYCVYNIFSYTYVQLLVLISYLIAQCTVMAHVKSCVVVLP
jgi:hypothetical protein